MTSESPRPRVVLVDGVPMSALVAQAPDPRAVILAVHGGATSSAYFDCPGRPDLSLLRAAATAGFTTIALDRPGYGTSAVYAAEFADPARRVASSFAAVDKILAGADRGAGLFVLGHSAGCELALRMATSGDDVVGVELAGTGLRYGEKAKEVIATATVTNRPAGLRDLLWEPTDLYPAEVLTGALSAPGVAYEGDVTANWARRDFPAIAADVRVPVQFSIAEHEKVWETDPEAVSAIAGLFTASPRVRINEVAASGHNLSVGLTAGEYHRTVMSFIDECIAAADGRDREQVEAS
ncbi:alpha/beta fold hydrolase [Mycolicibacterium vanbaalenii]|uniref:alpha/beta hydrolase n=1 Tax=Mycolicibacterium TaxID=1866885 RepID=UPI001F481E0E|nr:MULTISPECIES: alpha/beta hydrolase [Mycolicibacterium]MDW5611124.1 alpha/beta hydrolase [Mycolicibacterium sp. D5.8-2]UJL28372.1 alpha/beta fold hydrolase [Mycolicibacterium vanbaalenii]WND55066.1 alpha/beta hydrolase [Mycolicibacterium vanbaalenii]